MKKYRTYLILSRSAGKKIEKLSFINHSLIIQNEPTTCFWESKDGKVHMHSIKGRDATDVRPDEIPQYELLIEATSKDSALDLLSVIHVGMLIAYPDPGLASNYTFLSVVKGTDADLYSEEYFRNRFMKIGNVAFGCQFASSAMTEKRAISSA